ncbi:MAG: AhpC/TSA family protein [Bacteroidales bacterium]|nr:AhpC/TSA family protein [Bacteroidales bacterium]
MARLNLFIISMAILLSGCGKNSFDINGTLTGAGPGTIVYLEKLGSNSIEKLDSATLDESGKFSFSEEIENPAFYLLRSEENSFLTALIEPGEKITLIAPADSLGMPSELKGSPGTQLLIDYNIRLQQTLEELGELNKVYEESMDSPNLETVMADLDNQASEILDRLNAYTKDYIDTNLNSLVTLVALYQQVVPQVYVLNPEADIDYFKKVDSTLYALYPDYEPVAFLHEQIATLVGTMDTAGAPAGALTPGSKVPEITLQNPDGEMVSLSSTLGSVVLLDFWAAWCPPCRAENPNLVAAYDRYHEKGFDIFQVSLDQTREEWLKGIQEDGLDKWHHVSDLLFWESSVVSLYGIQSIPTSYLLDREGRIIASNLRGDALMEALAQIFE